MRTETRIKRQPRRIRPDHLRDVSHRPAPSRSRRRDVEVSERRLAHGARRAGAFAGEFVYVVAVMFAALGAAVMVLGGFGPLRSTEGIVFFAVAGVIAGVHHLWYARHRGEIESSPEQRAMRERRGF
jgi:hypothetical protein